MRCALFSVYCWTKMTIYNSSSVQNEIEARYEVLYCSAELTGSENSIIIVICLNIFIAITAVLGNALILVALQKESPLHPPSKVLFRCLAITDLCVGLVGEPVAITYWMSSNRDPWNICTNTFVTNVVLGYALCGMSLLTTTTISVDRLLALALGLRYRQVVTKRRTIILLASLSAMSIIFSTIYAIHNQVAITYVHFVTALCLTISTVSYTTIFIKLRRRKNQVQTFDCPESNGYSSCRNLIRYKKAVNSALWLQIALVLCYTPSGLVIFLSTETPVTSSLVQAGRITTTFVFLNSSLNPILYCWKIKEVRQVVKNLLAKMWCL